MTKAINGKIKIPQLWSLGENDEKRDWYVDRIKALVLDEENTEENAKIIPSDCIENEISELGLPRTEIYKDWNKMINNSFKSDLVGRTKDGRDVYLHSLVLFARCREILDKDYESIFQKFNLATVYIFLEYLYCGTLNGLIRSEINNLYNLAVELNFNELINVMSELKNILLKGDCNEIQNLPVELKHIKNNINNVEISVTGNKKPEDVEEKDLFTEENVVDLTESSPEPDKVDESLSENESNAEKSYWSFIQHEKRKENLESRESKKEKEMAEKSAKEMTPLNRNYIEEENDFIFADSIKATEFQKQMSEDSVTKDLVNEFQSRSDKINNSECIILSSGSESKTEENFIKSQRDRSKTPSSINLDSEVPYFDPYENFHCFSEEQFSPLGLNSQSLLIGDISMDSLKLCNPTQDKKQLSDLFQEDSKRTVGYCSTPVSVRQVSKINSLTENFSVRRDKKRSNLSSSRLLRKSLGLQHKMKKSKSSSSRKKNDQRRKCQTKELTEALTNTILNELSNSVFNSSFSRPKKFVEITPTAKKEEFGESVTPYPNYSKMGESMLKEQLTKYGLKKNLAKSKARKILRHIYEELHPFYNTETGKIVKMLPTDSPKMRKKSKIKATCSKSAKTKKSDTFEEKRLDKKVKNHLNSSKDSELISDGTSVSFDAPTDRDSYGSEFDDLNETLTQSMPSNPVDLPSAFCEFIQNNSEYYQKILLYEPIWLEELQKNLKEVFKKHFKMSDIINFLDQKCITFRSAAQAKSLQKRNEKKKEKTSKKKKKSYD